MKKFLTNTWCTLSVLFIAWLVFSYAEIICKNMAPNPTYSPINLLTMMFR